MRAIYKCEEYPALTLNADTFNPMYGFTEDLVTGMPVRVQLGRNPSEMYNIQFHNGLAEVTEPEDIRAMRRYIRARNDNYITEVSFEGDEAELYPEPTTTPQPEPEKRGESNKERGEVDEYERLSEWDRVKIGMMRK